jgi:hypothetical protein
MRLWIATLPMAPKARKDRVLGVTYHLGDGKIRTWHREWWCMHHHKSCGRCGVGVCEHGGRKARCRDCGGGSICSHKVQRATCVTCQGTSICMHHRRRYYCRPCGGKGSCPHRNDKRGCIHCRNK